RTSPPIDGCVLAARWCACERTPPACVPYSHERRLRLIAAVQGGDQPCGARRVVGRLAVFHPHQTPATGFPLDPRAHPFSPPSPEVGPPGLRETTYATPRPELDPEQQESDSAS